MIRSFPASASADAGSTFIGWLQKESPAIWNALNQAAQDGLVVIDHGADSVTASNRLLLTYPDLHDTLQMINNNWAERHLDVGRHFSALVQGGAGGDHGAS